MAKFQIQSCLTGAIYLSWVLPPRAIKPGKPLETVGMGISQHMAMAPGNIQYLINVFLSMNFVPRTHVVVSVRVALAIRTGCARGLAMCTISVGLSMYFVHVV